jgi:hypothetical protein
MKKIRGDKLIGVIIHTYSWKYHKEIPCVYLKQAKMSFFFFFLLSSTKSENKRQNRSYGTGRGGGDWY